MKSLLILLTVVCNGLLVTAVAAQAPEPTIRCTLQVQVWQTTETGLEKVEEVESNLGYRNNESFVPLDLRVGTRTQPSRYRGTQKFTLWRRIEAPAPNGGAPQIRYEVAGETTFPYGAEQVLLYLQKSEKGWRLMPVDCSPSALKEGTLRIHNFSKGPLMACVPGNGKQQQQVAAGGTSEFDLSQLKDLRLPLRLLVQVGGQWKQVRSVVAAIDPRSRYLGLFYESPERPGQYLFRIERDLGKPLPEERDSEPAGGAKVATTQPTN